MKKLSLMAGMLILVLVSTISPTSLNGKFIVVSSDSSKLAVKLQINTNTGTDDLGGATIVIGFDKNVLNFSSNPVNKSDYVFSNFTDGNYNTATVTKPLSDRLWVNIDLPNSNDNKGTVIAGTNSWTDVVTLYFDVITPEDTILLNWLSASEFWGVYDGDNKTLLSGGTFDDLQIIPADTTSPSAAEVIATNSKTVTVKFSEKIDPVTASDKENYFISDNISINNVQLLPDSSSVLLKTSQHQSNFDYTLTISEIKDLAGNIISPNPNSVKYRLAIKSKGNRVKNTVNTVIASSWEGEYSADKTTDGISSGTEGSRWVSADEMPDTLTYDLGTKASLDSVRISFYKGESGRLYRYSLYSSEDSEEWTPVVKNIWSDESEWTELEFDSTQGRYVKLVIYGCNQGKKQASIWEFESYGAEIIKQAKAEDVELNSFELSQNYPNPFNPNTKIRYTIPQTSNDNSQMSKVLLKVYDILGNEITTLVDEEQSAGEHEIEFNANGLASGVYIYRFESAAYVDTKKMVLLR